MVCEAVSGIVCAMILQNATNSLDSKGLFFCQADVRCRTQLRRFLMRSVELNQLSMVNKASRPPRTTHLGGLGRSARRSSRDGGNAAHSAFNFGDGWEALSATENDRTSNAAPIQQVKLQRQRVVEKIHANQKAIDRAHKVVLRLDKVLHREDCTIGVPQGALCVNEKQKVPS
jgi:hypothetical protein